MTDIRSLEQTLLDNLPWNKARIKFETPYAQLAMFKVKLLGVTGPYTPELDRTNWEVGAVDLNILMLSISYRSIGVPVAWVVLSNPGASNTSERLKTGIVR
jgi:hypothetical protein